jgi:hypothetical protein
MQWYVAMHTIRKGQVRWLTKAMYSVNVPSFTPCLVQQKAVIDCMAFCATSRHLRQILLDSVRTEMPARQTPDQLAWGPRSGAAEYP